MTENSRSQYLREEYIARINRVIDYIGNNIDCDLSLPQLADIAGFSAFHFHRIFSAIMGETLNGFIQRLRIEKAAAMLLQNRKYSISRIALECGFSGASTFARAFKEKYHISASQWRAGEHLSAGKDGIADSKQCKTQGNNCKEFTLHSLYSNTMRKQIWRVEMKSGKALVANVEVKEVPEMMVAYIRHIGPYQGDVKLFGQLINKLCTWAGPRGLLNRPDAKMLIIYHDNPDITDNKKLRTDVCISVPPDTGVDGEIGKAVVPAGKNAVARFEIAVDQFGDAWNAVYGGWLPESGYQPDDRPCYELYLNNPQEHPQGKYILEIYVPVKPL
jgi:AraC family transcriptional regulator